MNPLIIGTLAAGALLFFTGKNSKASKQNDFDIPDLPDMEDPTGINPSEPVYTTPVPKYGVPSEAQPSNSSSQASSGSSTSNNNVSTDNLKSLQVKNGGMFSAYQRNLADGIHLLKTSKKSSIGVVDVKRSLGIKALKNIPSGQIVGRFAGMIYTAKSGSRYVVAYGYRSGLIFFVALSNAVISTNDTGKRIILKNLDKGEYIIS